MLQASLFALFDSSKGLLPECCAPTGAMLVLRAFPSMQPLTSSAYQVSKGWNRKDDYKVGL